MWYKSVEKNQKFETSCLKYIHIQCNYAKSNNLMRLKRAINPKKFYLIQMQSIFCVIKQQSWTFRCPCSTAANKRSN